MELEFTDDALEAVAEQALLRGTGARGLRAILEEVLLDVMYDLPEPHRRRASASSTGRSCSTGSTRRWCPLGEPPAKSSRSRRAAS